MSLQLKIGGACLNQTPIDWANNLDNIQKAVEYAKQEGLDILCLPELCLTGYGCEDLFLSSWLPETALEKLESLIPLTKGILVTIGLPAKLENHVYNTTCIISDGKVLGFYAKQRLANDGVHYEPRWFTSWESGKKVEYEFLGRKYPFGHISVKHKGISIAFEICEDAWHEDRPACHLVDKADLILNPSASHFAFKKASYREELVRKSSEKFGCVYLYTNLLGNEAGRMIYDGDILIAQKGTLLARNNRLSFKNINLLSLDVDFEKVTSEKKIAPDFKSQNMEFSKAASLAMFDYLRKSKSQGFVLSLSGGADSSTIATLIAELVRFGLDELGKAKFQQKIGFQLKSENKKDIVNQILFTAYQGTKNSSEATFNSAKELAESLGAKFTSWNIDEEVSSYTSKIELAIKRKLNWKHDDIALQNIQARARSPIVWMLANINNALLLATSNRSEGDVGYTTMDGDTSGSISPIAGVSKSFLLQWLKFAQNELGYQGLSFVNQLTPTAELRPDKDQTDEEDLMPYEVLLKIERAAILNGQSPKTILEKLQVDYPEQDVKKWLVKFFSLWTRNQWKRERFAPSFHFDDFNIDPRSWYRFPILSGGFKEELAKI